MTLCRLRLAVLSAIACIILAGCDTVPITDADREAARASAGERVEQLEKAKAAAEADPETPPAVLASIGDRLAEAERQRRQVEEALERIAAAEAQGKVAGDAIGAITGISPLPAWLAGLVSLVGGAGAVWLRVAKDVRGFRQLVNAIDVAKVEDKEFAAKLQANRERLRAVMDTDVARRIDELRVG